MDGTEFHRVLRDHKNRVWNYACYINHIAEAGKAEYPLPMFVNAWIVQPSLANPRNDPPLQAPTSKLQKLSARGIV